MKLLFLAPLPVVVLMFSQPSCHAQARAAKSQPVASFFGTYTYLTYSILDKGTSPVPLPAKGVGGALTLRPNGTYLKSLTMAGNGTTLHFDQEGQFILSPGRITFSHSDQKGQPRTDSGTFRLVGKLLTITLEGYPAGNQSIYTLRAQ